MYQCEKCKDEEGFYKWIPRESDPTKQYQLFVECECSKRREAAKLFASSRITDAFRNKRFTVFNTSEAADCVKDAYDTAVEYVQNFEKIRYSERNSIALLGKSGSGKTHLLMAVANRLLACGVPVLYFPWVDGFNELKSNFDQLDRRLKLMQTVDVLYIDDLFKGRERPTPWQLETLFSVVNYRYENQLPMLICSERTIDQLTDPETGDEAIGSRIWQRSKDYTVILSGDVNYRMRD